MQAGENEIGDERHGDEIPRHRTAHDIAEAERLLRSYGYADAIRERPEMVREARQSLQDLVHGDEATLGQRLWYALLHEPVETILRGMTGDDPEGRLLRSNNPFSLLIGRSELVRRNQTQAESKANTAVRLHFLQNPDLAGKAL